jgi:hypothetical protein
MLCTTTVPVTGKAQQLRQFRSGGVPARPSRRRPDQNLPVERTFLILVKGADPLVTDPLSSHGHLQTINQAA